MLRWTGQKRLSVLELGPGEPVSCFFLAFCGKPGNRLTAESGIFIAGKSLPHLGSCLPAETWLCPEFYSSKRQPQVKPGYHRWASGTFGGFWRTGGTALGAWGISWERTSATSTAGVQTEVCMVPDASFHNLFALKVWCYFEATSKWPISTEFKFDSLRSHLILDKTSGVYFHIFNII